MKKVTKAAVSIILLGLFSGSFATPSSEFWTNMTTDIQGFGILHAGVDNYFTVAKKFEDGAGAFPTDVGLTMGVLPFSKVLMEIGVDLIEPLDNSVYFNAKLALPENAISPFIPAAALGIYNVGTEAPEQNVMFAALGKTIPMIGRLFLGGYMADTTLFGKEYNGLTVAYDRSFLPTKSSGGVDYSRLLISVDYATGDNPLGGGGIGIGYYFNENVSILTGPVFFTNKDINGEWKWSIQLDANIKAW